MERKIGEIFEYNGEWYQCVEGETICSECDLRNIICQRDTSINNPFKECSGNYRTDKKNIIFKKLEKVGEPYEFDGHLFQSYHTFEVSIFTENYATVRELGNNSKISIEIKQSKEDMEEKKQCGDTRFRIIARAKEHLFQATNIAEDKKELEVLDSFLLRCWQMGWLKQYEDAEEKKLNLKPFDLQKAREGKPVCTRDGRKARIICFDRRGDKFPIVALLDGCNKKHSEVAVTFTNEGLFEIGEKSSNDLMMLPEKKEGWINIIKTEDGVYCCKGELHSDYNDAFIENINVLDNRGITVKIEWEE